MTAPVIAFLVPGARLDPPIELIRPGIAIGLPLVAGAARRRAPCANAISPACPAAALRP